MDLIFESFISYLFLPGFNVSTIATSIATSLHNSSVTLVVSLFETFSADDASVIHLTVVAFKADVSTFHDLSTVYLSFAACFLERFQTFSIVRGGEYCFQDRFLEFFQLGEGDKAVNTRKL